MNRKLYLFDFDGTITTKDSYIDFFLKTFGYRYIITRILKQLPKVLTLLIKKDKAKLKEFLTCTFLKHKHAEKLNELGENYVDNCFHQLMNAVAVKEITSLQKNKENTIYIVSASLDLWLSHFAEKLDINLICTELEYKNDVFTGTFKTKNCKGIEKVKRIKQVLSLDDFDEILVFGDSKGDLEMLELGSKTFYKPFRK
jgi:HAD superfamily hydrolase (TIGR01490 family)